MRKPALTITRAARRRLSMLPATHQVVRWSLWIVPIAVIMISLLSSFSQLGPRGGTTDTPALSFDSFPPVALMEDMPAPGQPSSGAELRLTLAQWADIPGEWRSGDLTPQNSAYHEGESVPFMLSVENAVPGVTYVFEIRHTCWDGSSSGYDFLSRYRRDRGFAPALHEDGPGSPIPDSTLAAPDQPDTTLDDAEHDRTFELWGGTFASPIGLSEPDSCPLGQDQQASGVYVVSLAAQAQTLYLLWSGHLAPAPNGTPGPSLRIGGREVTIQADAILPPVQGLAPMSLRSD